MPSQSLTIRLPKFEETFSVFPDNGLNPHYANSRAESRAWINQYHHAVCGPNMRTFMDKCNFELAGALFYPYANEAGLRATMDLANLLWLYDELTDTKTETEAVNAAHIVACALREPDFDDGTWICSMIKDFNQRHISKAGPNTAYRFIYNFCTYVEAIGTEAGLRAKNEILDITTYISFRRETSALRLTFDLVEYCLGIDLPQYVHDDPVFTSGYNAAMDLVCWTNDLFSYNREQAKGHAGANVLTVIMKSKGLDIQSAVDFVGGYCEALTSQLVEARRILLSRSHRVYSKDAVRVLEGFGDFAKGNDTWSFASERYFGQKNKTVKETRIVEIITPFSDLIAINE